MYSRMFAGSGIARNFASQSRSTRDEASENPESAGSVAGAAARTSGAAASRARSLSCRMGPSLPNRERVFPFTDAECRAAESGVKASHVIASKARQSS